ncbi:MAG: toll/interleukin-1 receptor domain-containing protein [Blastocatellia bacterium]
MRESYDWYFVVVRKTREIRQKAFDALEAFINNENEKASLIKTYLQKDYKALESMWPTGKDVPSNLGRHINFSMECDYKDMLRSDIAEIEASAEQYFLNQVTLLSQTKPQSPYTYDVFVSYSSLDEKEADILHQEILAAGGKAFLSSKNLKPGDDFVEEIRIRLQSSRELWLLVTPNSLKSEWVLTEWGAAWMSRKKIVPLLHGCRPADLPDRLNKIQCIEFYKRHFLIKNTFS